MLENYAENFNLQTQTVQVLFLQQFTTRSKTSLFGSWKAIATLATIQIHINLHDVLRNTKSGWSHSKQR